MEPQNENWVVRDDSVWFLVGFFFLFCFNISYLIISLLNYYVCGKEEERSSVASGSTSWELEMALVVFSCQMLAEI